MFELAEDLDLRVDGLFQVKVFFEHFEVDLFDGHPLFASILEPLVHLAERALPQAFGLIVAVPTDHLQC